MEYESSDTVIHRLTVASKFIWVCTMAVVGFIWSSPYYLVFMVIYVFIIARMSKYRHWKSFFFICLPMIITIVVIQSLLPMFPNATILFYLIPEFVPIIGGLGGVALEGVIYGLGMACRFICIVLPFFILMKTTIQHDIMTFMTKNLKLSSVIALMATLMLRFIPTMLRELTTILEAQKSRGYVLGEMGPIERLRSYAPLIVPLFINSLMMADTTAATILSRGYGGLKVSKTYYLEATWTKADYVFLVINLAITSVVVVLGLFYSMGVYRW